MSNEEPDLLRRKHASAHHGLSARELQPAYWITRKVLPFNRSRKDTTECGPKMLQDRFAVFAESVDETLNLSGLDITKRPIPKIRENPAVERRLVEAPCRSSVIFQDFQLPPDAEVSKPHFLRR